MTWFGTSWGALMCEMTPQVPVPVGESCWWCEEPITADDSGVTLPMFLAHDDFRAISYHVECFMRQSLGSVAHQLKLCSCFGGGDAGYEHDEPSISRRDNARAAWDLAQEMARMRCADPD